MAHLPFHDSRILREDPQENSEIMMSLIDHITAQGGYGRGEMVAIYTSFTEMFLNALEHSKTGTGLGAQSLHKQGYPVTIDADLNETSCTITIANTSDTLRADEIKRRAEILRLNPRAHIGPARHIYQDDPRGHGGRGNGLRDIFTHARSVDITTQPQENLSLNRVCAHFDIFPAVPPIPQSD